LAALDALSDLNFALAGEQRHRTHLAQVDAHWVADLQLARGAVELEGLCFVLQRLFEDQGTELGLVHVDAVRADGSKQVVQILRRMHGVACQTIHLVVGDAPFVFGHQ